MLFCYTDSFHDNCGSHREFQYTKLEIFLSSLKSAWDLIYPGQNRDVREILSNLIGLLEDWKLEKTATNYEKSKPRIGVYLDNNYIEFLFTRTDNIALVHGINSLVEELRAMKNGGGLGGGGGGAGGGRAFFVFCLILS